MWAGAACSLVTPDPPFTAMPTRQPPTNPVFPLLLYCQVDVIGLNRLDEKMDGLATGNEVKLVITVQPSCKVHRYCKIALDVRSNF